MRTRAKALLLASLMLGCSRRAEPEPRPRDGDAPAMTEDVYALSATTLEGEATKLDRYRGKVSLLVNVASSCGYTPQYAGLQRLHERYGPRGFTVLGFPSNDFGRQEPGSPEDIREFCSSKYRVSFPMLSKVQTKPGPGQSEIYATLARAAGTLPSWNFGKYLVDRQGKVLKFFPSQVEPEAEELVASIEAALGG
jgi:glutathione peroxidase